MQQQHQPHEYVNPLKEIRSPSPSSVLPNSSTTPSTTNRHWPILPSIISHPINRISSIGPSTTRVPPSSPISSTAPPTIPTATTSSPPASPTPGILSILVTIPTSWRRRRAHAATQAPGSTAAARGCAARTATSRQSAVAIARTPAACSAGWW